MNDERAEVERLIYENPSPFAVMEYLEILRERKRLWSLVEVIRRLTLYALARRKRSVWRWLPIALWERWWHKRVIRHVMRHASRRRAPR